MRVIAEMINPKRYFFKKNTFRVSEKREGVLLNIYILNNKDDYVLGIL